MKNKSISNQTGNTIDKIDLIQNIRNQRMLIDQSLKIHLENGKDCHIHIITLISFCYSSERVIDRPFFELKPNQQLVVLF